jgi:hypothetical protein
MALKGNVAGGSPQSTEIYSHPATALASNSKLIQNPGYQ